MENRLLGHETTHQELLIFPGRGVRPWVGLPHDGQGAEDDAEKRLRAGRLGWLVLPVVIGTAEGEVRLRVRQG